MTVLEAMGGEQAEAIGTLATMVGARALARAVSDDAFSMEILRAVKKSEGEAIERSIVFWTTSSRG
jgi:hypothetical protein